MSSMQEKYDELEKLLVTTDPYFRDIVIERWCERHGIVMTKRERKKVKDRAQLDMFNKELTA